MKSRKDSPQVHAERSSRALKLNWTSVIQALSQIATCIALIYAIRNFNSTQKTSRRQLRSYVMFDAITVPHFEPGKEDFVQLAFKNLGTTPALDVAVSFSPIGTGPCAMVEDAPRESPIHGPLGQQQERRTERIGVNMNDACVALLNSGQATFDFRAEVAYKDIFDEMHHTNACYRYTPSEKFGVLPCPTGNSIE